MRIVTDKNKIESDCYNCTYKEGQIISRKLVSICLINKNKDCVGLAHNQIGGNKRVFVAKINNKWRSFINPYIVSTSNDYIMHEESCMSFPNKFNKVKRYTGIKIKHHFLDTFITEEFTGFNAFIIQHEIDHLNGIHIFNKKENK